MNIIHNLEDAFLECDNNATVKRWSKEDKQWNTVAAPGWLQIYRDTHGYVDHLRNVTSRVHFPFRHSYGWRVRLNGWIEMLTSNSYRYWMAINKLVWMKTIILIYKSEISYGQYVQALVQQLRTADNLEYSWKRKRDKSRQAKMQQAVELASATSIKFSALIAIPSHSRDYCSQCKKSRVSKKCPCCNVILHEGACNILFHNKNLIFH